MSGAPPFEKAAAMAFLEDTGIMHHVEEGVNQACRTRPQDTCGFLSEYFFERSEPPRVAKVDLAVAPGGDGFPQLRVTLHVTTCNVIRKVACASPPRSLFAINKVCEVVVVVAVC